MKKRFCPNCGQLLAETRRSRIHNGTLLIYECSNTNCKKQWKEEQNEFMGCVINLTEIFVITGDDSF